jgi:hypothetical protein
MKSIALIQTAENNSRKNTWPDDALADAEGYTLKVN